MKDLRHIMNDAEYLDEVKSFTRKYFISKNKELIRQFRNGEKPRFENPKWGQLKLILYRKQSSRCAICEERMPQRRSADIEHFRNKAHYWWLAYNYTNYYLACSECNSTNKGEQFPIYENKPKNEFSTRKNAETPLLINPYIENPYDFFEVVLGVHSKTNQNILMLKPKLTENQAKASSANQLNFQKALTTIKVYNLDLSNYKDDKNYTQLETFKLFFNQLYELGRKVVRAKKSKNKADRDDLKKYWAKLKEENSPILELGYTQMIITGQIEILF